LSEPEPEVRATYIDHTGREHFIVDFIRPTHRGGVPLVTILEGGKRDTITLAAWRKKRAGMVLS
jgi:hypothetical protein